MKNQNGAISTGAVIGLGFVGFILIILLVAATSYIGANNYGARIEAQLNAEYDNNMQILAQGQQKVMEAAQVPAMYKDDFKEIISADVQGRYGKDGSKATFQWLKEHDVALDSAMYKKVQQLIESYRDEFKNSQTKMIDVRRQYEAEQGLLWRGMWLRIAGFPKVDMSKFKPIVTDAVQEIYKNGKESGPMKLR
jgi:hypothetical protein